jgi:hypothetical protein
MSIDKLHDKVTQVYNTEAWKRWEALQNDYPQYQEHELRKVASQMSWATGLGPESFWNKYGRKVVEGAPSVFLQGEKHYDISGTEGDELPSVVTLLKGRDTKGRLRSLAGVAREQGWSVQFTASLPNGVHGETRYGSKKVYINTRNSQKHKIKSIAHEIAHVILHKEEWNRAKAEIEAESVAFLVCDHLGIDSSPYSAGYIASWAQKGEEMERYFDNVMIGNTAQRICDRILEK